MITPLTITSLLGSAGMRKATGAGEVSVNGAVLKALPDFRRRFPDVNFAAVKVQADYAKEQIAEVWRALIEAIALTLSSC